VLDQSHNLELGEDQRALPMNATAECGRAPDGRISTAGGLHAGGQTVTRKVVFLGGK
jgi:hypothetical protein